MESAEDLIKRKIGSRAKKSFNRFTTKDSYPKKITHTNNMESAAV